ncbi:MAG: ATP-binding protein [Hyphomonadaceae bacterium JAD_PAG50586_4]|nr:MAG: ATP-binding protein [Hyphomonadaceae bacterium JAD_PAG50586_4]
MSFAEQTSATHLAPHQKRQPLQRRRLDLIYYALAVFDLLTIGFTLMLSNHTMDLYQLSVSRSAVWSARVAQVVQLARFAQEANAPGNDVFDSQDVTHERARRAAGGARYQRQRDAVLQDLSMAEPGEEVAAVIARIHRADRHMREMMAQADLIFAEIERGDDEAAGRRMATMDRIYARLSNDLLGAILAVQAIEDRNLARQVELAASLRRLEVTVMALIFVIVVGVTLYGRRIGEVMRRTEDAHNAMLEELEAANEGLQQYADNVAHELRNPVNKMLLASEVVLSRARSSQEYEDTLVSIVEESQRLSNIVGSLLFLARAKQTQFDLDRTSIDVAAELEVIRQYFEVAADTAGVTLSVDGRDTLTLAVDRTLFQRAMSNLVSNAIAHTPRGGSVSMRARRGDGCVLIEVIDTGEGVSSEDKARVFDRFYRADKARNPASGRLGLGLPIAKSIMELHAGSMALESEPGEGTIVTLRFPSI